MWTHILQFEFAAKLGDEQFRAHEDQLKSSRYGIMRFAVDRLAQLNAGEPGGPPGDLYFDVRVLDHPLFRREGDHLYVTCASNTTLEFR